MLFDLSRLVSTSVNSLNCGTTQTNTLTMSYSTAYNEYEIMCELSGFKGKSERTRPLSDNFDLVQWSEQLKHGAVVDRLQAMEDVVTYKTPFATFATKFNAGKHNLTHLDWFDCRVVIHTVQADLPDGHPCMFRFSPNFEPEAPQAAEIFKFECLAKFCNQTAVLDVPLFGATLSKVELDIPVDCTVLASYVTTHVQNWMCNNDLKVYYPSVGTTLTYTRHMVGVQTVQTVQTVHTM